MLAEFRRRLLGANHSGHRGGLEILRWIGPGLLVTVGFIDPGNWATNMAAGSTYGYGLLWVVTLSTVMLVILQHTWASSRASASRRAARTTCRARSRGPCSQAPTSPAWPR